MAQNRTPVYRLVVISLVVILTLMSSHAVNGKDCKYNDPGSGEQISYEVGKPGLVKNKEGELICPPASNKKIWYNLHIENYKKKGERFVYKNCTKHGGTCKAHTECCQSYVRSKAAANLPVIMFPNCIKGKCVACLHNAWPCGKGSKIPCCGSLVGNIDIKCREKDPITFSPYLPTPWPLCAPAPCDTVNLKKLNLYQTPCYGYGKDYPQYFGVNLCKCEDGQEYGYKCNDKKQCLKCKIEGFDTDSQCTKDSECCKNHICIPNNATYPDGKTRKECFQRGNCVLEGQRDECDGKNSDDGSDRKCCDGLRCLVVHDNNNKRLYSLCTRQECTEEDAPCDVDYHCCVKKGLVCQRKTFTDGERLKVCSQKCAEDVECNDNKPCCDGYECKDKKFENNRTYKVCHKVKEDAKEEVSEEEVSEEVSEERR